MPAHTQKQVGISHHFDYLIHGKNTANGLGVGEEGGGSGKGGKEAGSSLWEESFRQVTRNLGWGSSEGWQERSGNLNQGKLRHNITEMICPRELPLLSINIKGITAAKYWILHGCWYIHYTSSHWDVMLTAAQ